MWRQTTEDNKCGQIIKERAVWSLISESFLFPNPNDSFTVQMKVTNFHIYKLASFTKRHFFKYTN